jgi:hypothetical protein
MRSTNDDIIAVFQIDNRKIVDRASEKMDALRRSTVALEKLRQYPTVENLRDYTRAAYANDPSERLATEFKNHTKTLPGDVFYIDKISSLQGRGFFALMRYLGQCSVDGIAINTEYDCAHAIRFARLQSPYIYAMTQSLGKVFSDIGLPNEHKEDRESIPAHFFVKAD